MFIIVRIKIIIKLDIGLIGKRFPIEYLNIRK